MLLQLTLLVFLGALNSSCALNGHLTHYCSFPPCCESKVKPPYNAAEKKACPGKSECRDYEGCKYQGEFSFIGRKSHQYVIDTNIVSFFSTHGDINKYKNKKLRITQGKRTIDAIVADTCSDEDCHGCCTENAGPTGYLIDMEANTYARFGGSDGPVKWSCLNCK